MNQPMQVRGQVLADSGRMLRVHRQDGSVSNWYGENLVMDETTRAVKRVAVPSTLVRVVWGPRQINRQLLVWVAIAALVCGLLSLL